MLIQGADHTQTFQIKQYSEMPRKRKKIDASLLLGLRSVPLSVARRVIDALPDLDVDYDLRGLRYDLECAREELIDEVLCIVELPMDDATT